LGAARSTITITPFYLAESQEHMSFLVKYGNGGA